MLTINLKGKKAFIAGVGDDQGYGWAIAKSLAEAGATILIGTWTPMLKIFTMALENGKFDDSRKLSDGSLMQIAKNLSSRRNVRHPRRCSRRYSRKQAL